MPDLQFCCKHMLTIVFSQFSTSKSSIINDDRWRWHVLGDGLVCLLQCLFALFHERLEGLWWHSIASHLQALSMRDGLSWRIARILVCVGKALKTEYLTKSELALAVRVQCVRSGSIYQMAQR